jgi:hypothetical protein
MRSLDYVSTWIPSKVDLVKFSVFIKYVAINTATSIFVLKIGYLATPSVTIVDENGLTPDATPQSEYSKSFYVSFPTNSYILL